MNEANRTTTIAQNTILLYMRSIIVLILAIYTSRVLLMTLGIDDYGLYNVVGGVVAMFLSLKSIFAASVQRFINFEKGRGNNERVKEIFNTSVLIHIGIVIVFIIIVEICGLCYIPTKMVMPEGKQETAMFVFHCSVLATSVSIFTIPYDALIIANEKMTFYAWQSIIETTLKLLIVFCIPLLPFENLRTYAILVLLVSIIMRIISVRYSKRFPECEKLRIWNKNTVKQLASFTSWNILGCVVSSIIEEGSNFIINFFGGVAANAARAIAYQIRNAVMTLSGNVFVASQPFIVQTAANSSSSDFWHYIYKQSKVMFLIVLLTALPIYTYTDEILQLWLSEVPLDSSLFVKSVLIYMVVMSFQKSLDLAFKSYNIMSKYQIVDSVICLLSIPLSICILKIGAPLYSIFIVFSMVRCIDYFCILLLAKKYLGLKIADYLKKVIVPACKVTSIAVMITMVADRVLVPHNAFLLVLYVCTILIVSISFVYVLALDSSDRRLANSILFKIIKNK